MNIDFVLTRDAKWNAIHLRGLRSLSSGVLLRNADMHAAGCGSDKDRSMLTSMQ
jgi:hypothetical protein